MRSARIIPSPLYVSHFNSSEARRKIVVVGTYLFIYGIFVGADAVVVSGYGSSNTSHTGMHTHSHMQKH